MKLATKYDILHKGTEYAFFISDWERARVKLDPVDHAVVFGKLSGDMPIADVALALEVLTRRLTEQRR